MGEGGSDWDVGKGFLEEWKLESEDIPLRTVEIGGRAFLAENMVRANALRLYLLLDLPGALKPVVTRKNQ